MESRKLLDYLQAVHAMCSSLEEKALRGEQLANGLGRRVKSIAQEELGLSVPLRSGEGILLPPFPNVFPWRTHPVQGRGDLRLPEFASLRLLLVQMMSGARTSELTKAVRLTGVANRSGVLPIALKVSGKGGQASAFASTPSSAQIVEREAKFQNEAGITSQYAFCRLDGSPLRLETVNTTSKALFQGCCEWYGVQEQYPGSRFLSATRQLLIAKLMGHQSMQTTAHYIDHASMNPALRRRFEPLVCAPAVIKPRWPKSE